MNLFDAQIINYFTTKDKSGIFQRCIVHEIIQVTPLLDGMGVLSLHDIAVNAQGHVFGESEFNAGSIKVELA